jgi:GAF domain-containing protein
VPDNDPNESRDSNDAPSEPTDEKDDQQKAAAEIEDWLAFVCRNIDGKEEAEDSEEDEPPKAKEKAESDESSDAVAPEAEESAEVKVEESGRAQDHSETKAETKGEETTPVPPEPTVAETKGAKTTPVPPEPAVAEAKGAETITAPPEPRAEKAIVEAAEPREPESAAAAKTVTEAPKPKEPKPKEPKPKEPKPKEPVQPAAAETKGAKTTPVPPEPTVSETEGAETITAPPEPRAEKAIDEAAEPKEPESAAAAKTVTEAPKPKEPVQPAAAETLSAAPKSERTSEPVQPAAAETITAVPKPEDTAKPTAAELVAEAPKLEEASPDSEAARGTQRLVSSVAQEPDETLLMGPAQDTITEDPMEATFVGPAESDSTDFLLAGPVEVEGSTLIGGTAGATDDVDSIFLRDSAPESASGSTLEMKGPSPAPPKPIPQPAVEVQLPEETSVELQHPTRPPSLPDNKSQPTPAPRTEPEPVTKSQRPTAAGSPPKVDLSFLQSTSAPRKTQGQVPADSASAETVLDLDSKVLKPTQKPAKSQESQAFKTTSKPSTPGGSLKFLEQALAQAVPGKLPAGLKKRAVTAVRHLFTLDNVQRAAVFAKNEQGNIEALAVGGLSPDKESLAQISPRLLRAVMSSGKPLLLLDCVREPRYAKDPIVTENQIRSVVCAPFTDTESGTFGLLYIDNCTAANAFSYQDLDTLTQFAHKMGTQADLSEYDPTPARGAASDKLNVEVEPVSPWLYVSLVVGALILVMPALYNTFFGASTPPPVTQSVNSQPIENPAAVIQGFIRALDAKSYGGAYTYLSEGLRTKISEEEFNKKVKNNLADYDKAWRLSRVNIRAGNIDQESLKSFRVTVGQYGPWTWTLQKSEGKWYIHEFEGGLNVP